MTRVLPTAWIAVATASDCGARASCMENGSGPRIAMVLPRSRLSNADGAVQQDDRLPTLGRSGRSKDLRAVAFSKAAVVARTTAGRSPSPGGRFEGPSGRSSLSRVTVVPRTSSKVALLRGGRQDRKDFTSTGEDRPSPASRLADVAVPRDRRPSPWPSVVAVLSAWASIPTGRPCHPPSRKNRPGSLSPGPRRRWPSWPRRLPVAARADLVRGMA